MEPTSNGCTHPPKQDIPIARIKTKQRLFMGQPKPLFSSCFREFVVQDFVDDDDDI